MDGMGNSLPEPEPALSFGKMRIVERNSWKRRIDLREVDETREEPTDAESELSTALSTPQLTPSIQRHFCGVLRPLSHSSLPPSQWKSELCGGPAQGAPQLSLSLSLFRSLPVSSSI
ncbi:unnamed protein product [Allacma fusca]|uniref:Uncharacterized protein n=1 Tax=Allacma fusca TaxID=39272 RepID=A0A8J2KUM3_9HEXA|nr:unnamed protein product [Allacma fusca]